MIFRRTEAKRTFTALTFLSSPGMAVAAKVSGVPYLQAERTSPQPASCLHYRHVMLIHGTQDSLFEKLDDVYNSIVIIGGDW